VTEPSVLLFGDTVGVSRLLRVFDPELVQAIVRAEIRPEQEAELTELAHAHGLPVLVQPRFDAEAYPVFAERVRSLAPRLIIVDSYSMLLRPDVLEVPALGAINVHYAPLPRYRGPNPTQWAIINGEGETAVTLHRMTAEIDAGPIVAQRRVPIRFEDTWTDVNERLDEAAESLLADQLPHLIAGPVTARPQDEADATSFPRRTPEDGRIDWSASVVRIHDLIRALVAPLPGAFYEAGGERVVLDRYLTVAEVVALKFGDAGGGRLAADSVRLRPTGGPADGRLAFSIEDGGGTPVGEVEMWIDWKIGSCRISVSSPKEHRAAAQSLAYDFAEKELLLAAVRVELDG
jgi:methionyl-tRNA formyltransferase